MKTLRETVQPLLKLFKGLKMEKIKIIYLLDLGIRKIHAKVMSIATACQMFERKLKKRFLRIHLADVLSDVVL